MMERTGGETRTRTEIEIRTRTGGETRTRTEIEIRTSMIVIDTTQGIDQTV